MAITSSSTTSGKTQIHRRLAVAWTVCTALFHQMERTLPAGLIEEMNDGVEQEAGAVCKRGLLILVTRLDEGPIDEERPAYDVLARHEAPVATIEADGTIVAHGKISARRNDQVAGLIDVRRQIDRPAGGDVAGVARRNRREVIAIRKVIGVSGFVG